MSEQRAISRAQDRRLLGELIAQAAVDQDQGLLQFSAKLERLIASVMERIGHAPPSRVSLDGLADLLEEAVGADEPGRGNRYPLAFRAPSGLLYRWVTVELDEVAIKGEKYTAAVIELHDE
jgi:hypothetical protein